jgi:hypothetical protein
MAPHIGERARKRKRNEPPPPNTDGPVKARAPRELSVARVGRIEPAGALLKDPNLAVNRLIRSESCNALPCRHRVMWRGQGSRGFLPRARLDFGCLGVRKYVLIL